ncbi:MAG: glycosyltransferase [Blastocatellales bacterium]
MNRLRILLTNNTLAERAGTELYVYDLAVALLARGHQPIAYSNQLGEVAESLRNAGVPVVDNLDSLGFAPNIIHGHHHLEAMTALLHFPHTPAIYFCHSWKYWEEMPVRFPRIRRYLAMNEATYNRLTCEHGIPEDQVRWMLNFVDLSRFKPRAPLPPRPARALVFSNYATEQDFLPVIRAACLRAGLPLDTIGIGSGNPSARPWEEIGAYDLIFASGRSALESLAVGAAVIVCNRFGLGPMVTAGELDWLRRTNFGFMSTLRRPFDADEALRQIGRYDAEDAAEVSRRIRATAGLETTVDRLLDLYAEVMAEHRCEPPISPEAEDRATSAYLRQLSGRLKTYYQLWGSHNQLQESHEHLLKSHEQLQESHAALQTEADWMRRSPAWRWRQGLARVPGLGPLYRLARHWFF